MDQGLARLVQEDQLLVRMAVNVLVVELAVKIRINGHFSFILRREDMAELRTCGGGIFLSLLGQALDTDDGCCREGACPVADEDVVLIIQGGDVADVVAEVRDGGFDFGGQGCGREDCQLTALKLD